MPEILDAVCVVCGGEVWRFSPSGRPYCQPHYWSARERAMTNGCAACGAPAFAISAYGKPLCCGCYEEHIAEVAER